MEESDMSGIGVVSEPCVGLEVWIGNTLALEPFPSIDVPSGNTSAVKEPVAVDEGCSGSTLSDAEL